MRKRLLLISFLILPFFSFSQKIILEGAYLGRNIYVQNPVSDSGSCTKMVKVNGKEIPFDKTTAFVIPLDSMGFREWDTLRIEIFHHADCKPRVLADNALPKNTFEIVSISLDSNAVLHWTAKNEVGKFIYTIEQYRWNKWVKVGETDGKGGIQENEYLFRTIPHSGKNQFRVKQVQPVNYPRFSKAVFFEAGKPDIKIIDNVFKLGDKLEFSKETLYELYDQDGNIVRKGYGKVIDLKKLKRGSYFLNYDNETREVVKFY